MTTCGHRDFESGSCEGDVPFGGWEKKFLDSSVAGNTPSSVHWKRREVKWKMIREYAFPQHPARCDNAPSSSSDIHDRPQLLHRPSMAYLFYRSLSGEA